MKLLKLVRKLVIVGVVAGLGYGVYAPDSFPIPALQPPLAKANQAVFDGKIDWKKLTDGAYHKGAEVFVKVAKNSGLPKKWLQDLPDAPDEIVVEDVVSAMSNEVRQLPQTQAERVKTAFCRDVIDEATTAAVQQHSGEVAGARDE